MGGSEAENGKQRVRPFEEPRLRALLEKASDGPGTAWLCPQTASPTPLGWPVLFIYNGYWLLPSGVTADGGMNSLGLARSGEAT